MRCERSSREYSTRSCRDVRITWDPHFEHIDIFGRQARRPVGTVGTAPLAAHARSYSHAALSNDTVERAERVHCNERYFITTRPVSYTTCTTHRMSWCPRWHIVRGETTAVRTWTRRQLKRLLPCSFTKNERTNVAVPRAPVYILPKAVDGNTQNDIYSRDPSADLLSVRFWFTDGPG